MKFFPNIFYYKSKSAIIFIISGEQDKDDAIKTNQKTINDHQNLVLKFQELDISQSTMIEKTANQIKTLKESHETQVGLILIHAPLNVQIKT